MAILHKNISAEGDIHNPKWFSGANNGDVAWRNELGVLESTDELVLPAALNFVDGSVAPPTSNSGDIYVISSGASVNAGWGTVALGDWVRYDGTTWNVITPQKSTLCYNETTDALNSYDGSTWSAIGGGGGGASIYTADGTLTGDRVVDLDNNILTFDVGTFSGVGVDKGLIIDGSDYQITNTNSTNSFLEVFNENGTVFNAMQRGGILSYSDVNPLAILLSRDSTKGLKLDTNNSRISTNELIFNNSFSGNQGIYLRGSGVTNDLFFRDSLNQIQHRIRQGDSGATASFFYSGMNGKGFIVGGSSAISGEDISLQSSTAIKGIGTSGSSALAIYDNDTTPTKLWDFLDNGNVNLGGDSVINQDSNVLQFSNINSIGGLKFNGTSNNGIGLNLANGSNDFDFVVAGSSNTLIGTGSLGLLVGGSWAMQVKQNRQISIGSNFEPVAGYDLSVDKAYFDTEITVKAPAGIMQFNGYRTHNIDPSTATFPNDKDFGVHKNTSSGDVFLAFNDGGTIKKVQLT